MWSVYTSTRLHQTLTFAGPSSSHSLHILSTSSAADSVSSTLSTLLTVVLLTLLRTAGAGVAGMVPSAGVCAYAKYDTGADSSIRGRGRLREAVGDVGRESAPRENSQCCWTCAGSAMRELEILGEG